MSRIPNPFGGLFSDWPRTPNGDIILFSDSSGDVVTLVGFLHGGLYGLSMVALWFFCSAFIVMVLGMFTLAPVLLGFLAVESIFDVDATVAAEAVFAGGYGFTYVFSGFWAFIVVFITGFWLKRRLDP